MNLSDYRLALLRKGDPALYRGTCEGRQPVLVAMSAAGNPSTECVARLQHEFVLKSRLNARWAALPVSLTRYYDQIALVLDDPGGTPLRSLCHAPTGIAEFLPLAASLATAVQEIHAQGLIHRDITPDNILVDVKDSTVWLTGFGRASHYPKEDRDTEPLRDISESFAYMAPEQTGRMNRLVDPRADIYALGCIFYEMLTAAHPLTAKDPMKWAHSHIARQPVSLDTHVSGIPQQIARMVMKLLAKAPEDRYQTAKGLLADLNRCLCAWERGGRIGLFQLDTLNISSRLKVSERLYGRETEMESLLSSFDSVATYGARKLVLISGHSGCGKSSLVRELRNWLHERRHLFAFGKCEQVKSAIPYAALAQALQSLVHPILGMGEEDFLIWRERLISALGNNARLLCALVPDLGVIVGDLPSDHELPPRTEKTRFLRTLRRFVSAFASLERPLVLFLDDLQWMDEGTQEAVEYLVTESGVSSLLLIGAFRDNEIAPHHPLRRGFGEVNANVREIALMPLEQVDLAQLVSDMLACPPEQAAALAELVKEMTDGDPFFATQFIAALVEEGYVAPCEDSASWAWDLGRIRARGYFDNVIDLVSRKFDLLPAATQAMSRYLACLGSSAKIETLAIAAGVSPACVQKRLAQTCEANLVHLSGDVYSFLHDRIQEAVYLTIADNDRAFMHLEIGRRLIAPAETDQAGNTIFETVNQINRGPAFTESAQERRQFARLNLLAGQRAKAASAYASALPYLTVASRLLGDGSEDRMAYETELLRAECEFLTGASSAAEARLATLSRCSIDLPMRADLTRIQAALYTTLDRPDVALEKGLDYFRRVGVEVPLRPTDEDVDAEHRRILKLLDGRAIEELRDLPLITDPVWRGTMDVFADLVPAALFTDANLHDLIRLRMTNISLERGHCDASSYAYVCAIFGFRYENYDMAFRFGELARYLIAEKGLTRFEARVENSFSALVLPWKYPAQTGQVFMKRAIQIAAESGDLTFECYARRNLISNQIFAGTPLEEMQTEAEKGLAFVQRKKFRLNIDAQLAQIIMFRRLRGLPLDTPALLEAGYDRSWVDTYASGGSSPRAIAAFAFWTHTLQSSFLLSDIDMAMDAQEKARVLYWSSRSHIETAEFHFYSALVRAAAFGLAPADRSGTHLNALNEHYRQLLLWKQNCPENFACRTALVEAELSRIDNRPLDAEQSYEDAIRQSQEQGFLQIDALANELAASFYAKRGLDTIARTYFRNARYAYFCWGAHAKVCELETRYSYLRDSPLSDRYIKTDGGTVRQLDLGAVIKASHALSGEIVLSKLIKTLMANALEHAGGQWCVLALFRGAELWTEAEASLGSADVDVTLRQSIVAPGNLPVSLVQTVVRTRSCVVLDDAREAGAFAHDEYMQRKRPRSTLCMPLIKQSQLVGLLYMENNLTAGAFTPERTSILEVLASQAAVSIENARLYADLVEENRQRERAEDALRGSQTELARVARLTTMGELVASIVHEVSQPLTAVGACAGAAIRWLDREEPNLGEARDMLKRIVNDSTRATEVIRGLRALAKKASPELARFNINEAIHEVLALTGSQRRQSGVELDESRIAGMRLVNGDRVQLQQVVLNLVLNGVEAMSGVADQKQRLLTVSSEVNAAGDVVVKVSDTGTGLDAATVSRIFEPFVTTKDNGMGMGLSICRGIIEAHDGELTAAPNEGRGTTFQFTLRDAR